MNSSNIGNNGRRVVYSEPLTEYASKQEAIKRDLGPGYDGSFSQVDQMVDQIIENLIPVQRDIMERHYYSGLSTAQIAIELGMPGPKVRYQLTLAKRAFKKEIERVKGDIGLSPDHLQCTICSSDDRIGIDEFIHIWVDTRGMVFRGLAKAVNDAFDIRIKTTGILREHIDHHMVANFVNNGDAKKEISKIVKKINDTGKKFTIDLNSDMYNTIEEFSIDLNRTKSDIIKEALAVGLQMMPSLVEINEILKDFSIQFSSRMRRIEF